MSNKQSCSSNIEKLFYALRTIIFHTDNTTIDFINKNNNNHNNKYGIINKIRYCIILIILLFIIQVYDHLI